MFQGIVYAVLGAYVYTPTYLADIPTVATGSEPALKLTGVLGLHELV